MLKNKKDISYLDISALMYLSCLTNAIVSYFMHSSVKTEKCVLTLLLIN